MCAWYGPAPCDTVVGADVPGGPRGRGVPDGVPGGPRGRASFMGLNKIYFFGRQTDGGCDTLYGVSYQEGGLTKERR